MTVPLEDLLVAPSNTMAEAMRCIDRTGVGIALVVDDDRRLLGTVTDGDIRRSMLDHLDPASSIEELLRRPDRPHRSPLTAAPDTPPDELLRLMTDAVLRQIPLVDADGRVVGVALLEDLVKEYELPLRAVVMAGGYGLRLRPLTDDVPKPMLPVGDKPLLELIVGRLRDAGIRQVAVTTHYRAEEISRHFSDGADFGIDIHYVNEEEPLGTAGALALLEPADEPILVMNGDILTQVDFRAMLQFHREHDAAVTVAVRPFEIDVPYGVVESDGVNVTGIAEKPVLRYFVNAGIYLLDPGVRRFVPAGSPHDMPDLLATLMREGHRVISFPVHEYWLDIGRLDEYERAQRDIAGGA